MFTSRSYLFILGLAAISLVYAALVVRLSYTEDDISDVYTDYHRQYAASVEDSFFSKPIDKTVSDVLTAAAESLSKGSKRSVVSAAAKPKPNEPTAQAYLVGDVTTGDVYISKNADTVMPVASMSKLITAITALATIPATSTIEVTESDMVYSPDPVDFNIGEKFSIKNMLYPMLLASSNTAAEALASTVNRTKFLESMSSFAWEIGMGKTFFADPSGIDPHNMASANDMFSLAKYLFNQRPDILAMTRNPYYEISSSSEHQSHDIESIHPFVSDPRFVGGKTGRTPQAGETMLTILNLDNKNLAFIILGAEVGHREGDTKMLIEKYKKVGH